MNVFEVRNNILLAKLKDHRYGHQTFHISQTLENRNWYESFDRCGMMKLALLAQIHYSGLIARIQSCIDFEKCF